MRPFRCPIDGTMATRKITQKRSHDHCHREGIIMASQSLALRAPMAGRRRSLFAGGLILGGGVVAAIAYALPLVSVTFPTGVLCLTHCQPSTRRYAGVDFLQPQVLDGFILFGGIVVTVALGLYVCSRPLRGRPLSPTLGQWGWTVMLALLLTTYVLLSDAITMGIDPVPGTVQFLAGAYLMLGGYGIALLGAMLALWHALPPSVAPFRLACAGVVSILSAFGWILIIQLLIRLTMMGSLGNTTEGILGATTFFAAFILALITGQHAAMKRRAPNAASYQRTGVFLGMLGVATAIAWVLFAVLLFAPIL
jgi:hypothetical protein